MRLFEALERLVLSKCADAWPVQNPGFHQSPGLHAFLAALNQDNQLARELITWPCADPYDELWRINGCVLLNVPFWRQYDWDDMTHCIITETDGVGCDEQGLKIWNGFLCHALGRAAFCPDGSKILQQCWWKTAQFFDDAIKCDILETYKLGVSFEAAYLATHLVYVGTLYMTHQLANDKVAFLKKRIVPWATSYLEETLHNSRGQVRFDNVELISELMDFYAAFGLDVPAGLPDTVARLTDSQVGAWIAKCHDFDDAAHMLWCYNRIRQQHNQIGAGQLNILSTARLFDWTGIPNLNPRYKPWQNTDFGNLLNTGYAWSQNPIPCGDLVQLLAKMRQCFNVNWETWTDAEKHDRKVKNCKVLQQLCRQYVTGFIAWLRDQWDIGAVYVPQSGYIRNRVGRAWTPPHIDRFYVLQTLHCMCTVFTVNVALSLHVETASNLTFIDNDGNYHCPERNPGRVDMFDDRMYHCAPEGTKGSRASIDFRVHMLEEE